uniref:Chromosome (Plasmid) partitioning protein ParB/stage 0 sporulation protein J n=1 Tax=uncultured bacterium F39-01 TaxID=1191434 RepID=I3VIC2_9BACT|nr:chromosome (plasmid) partitioning protein ParB/stage 0 sporulation protein J [uncultured bacterium F39-01]
MRHDAHYVEELSQQRPSQIGRMIPVDKLEPNPEQPRTEFGDLTELTASIAEKGVLEPLLVKPNRLTGRWMIIAGERRWRSAQLAGLKEVPCVEMEVDEGAVAEIALIENMQRKDLTVWEEADGLLALCDRFGYTHDDVARKVGKSRTTVTEAMAIARIPADVREVCKGADINAKSLLLQIVRQPDDDTMRNFAKQIASRGLNRNDAREVRRQEMGPRVVPDAKPYVFKFASPDKDFNIEVRFRVPDVKDAEVALILRAVADEIDDEPAAAE